MFGTFDKKYRIFSPCLCDRDSTTSKVRLQSAWPIGSKKTRTRSTISAIHKIASLTSNGYFISPSTRPGVSQKWTKAVFFCLLNGPVLEIRYKPARQPRQFQIKVKTRLPCSNFSLQIVHHSVNFEHWLSLGDISLFNPLWPKNIFSTLFLSLDFIFFHNGDKPKKNKVKNWTTKIKLIMFIK